MSRSASDGHQSDCRGITVAAVKSKSLTKQSSIRYYLGKKDVRYGRSAFPNPESCPKESGRIGIPSVGANFPVKPFVKRAPFSTLEKEGTLVRKWSKESIAQEIRALHEAGEDLNYSAVFKYHLALLRAAMRYFGSWREAIEYAGLSYEDVRRYRTWDKERIIERIRELYEMGEDLSWRHVSLTLDPQLAAAATKPKHFGSWRSAIEAAGLDYSMIRRYQEWNEERILQRLRDLHAKGVPLNAKSVEAHDITLITAARRRFESWDKALTAAGLDYKQIVLRAPFKRRTKATSTDSNENPPTKHQ
ncbi:hypothetical protein CP488_00416 [Chthonomonas calidirosea]|nr:hypothetical protein CP488_00416 [Chthonomonas calidirosea]